jgi:hypothetical protein
MAGFKVSTEELIVLDPVRSLTACADQGPREFQPFGLYLRRLTRDTGACVLLVHHDTKPSAAQVPDHRRPAQRASGGAIFSAVDCPIHVGRIDDCQSLVTPDGYKHSATPASFSVDRHVDGAGAWLTGTENQAKSADALALERKIVAVLRDHPLSTGTSVREHVKAKNDAVIRTLEALAERGDVVETEGKGTARLWSLPG